MFPGDVQCCRACWKPSSLGGGIDTSLLSKAQPLCVSVYLSLCQCVSGEIEALCWHISLAHTHTHLLSFSFCISLLFLPVLHPSPCLSSLCLRGIWGQSSRCRIRSHPVWQNDEHHTGWGLLDQPLHWQSQHTHAHTRTHARTRRKKKQTCWLYGLFCPQTTLKASLLHNK